MGNELSALPTRVALCFDGRWLLTAEKGCNIRAVPVPAEFSDNDEKPKLGPDFRFKVENDKKMLDLGLGESDGQDLLSVIFIRSDHHPQRLLGVSKDRAHQRGATTVNIATEWPGPEHRWVMEHPHGNGVVLSTQLKLDETEFQLCSRYVDRKMALRGSKFILEVDEVTGMLVLRVSEPRDHPSISKKTWKFVSVDPFVVASMPQTAPMEGDGNINGRNDRLSISETGKVEPSVTAENQDNIKSRESTVGTQFTSLFF